MAQQLLHIYGPLSVQSFGLMISIGFYVTLHLLLRHPKRKKLISHDHLIRILSLIVTTSIGSGRLLFLVMNWQKNMTLYHIFSFWDGGFSLLGSILGSGISVCLYLSYFSIPILPTLDILAVHAPLMQSISRVGCFMAGCCFGCPSSLPWHIIYTSNSSAPVGIPLHPAQLYSSITLLTIFTFLYFYAQKHTTKPGQLFYMYLGMIASERLIVDFFRGDREFINVQWAQFLSVHQLIACILILISAIMLTKSYNSVQIRTTTQKT